MNSRNFVAFLLTLVGAVSDIMAQGALDSRLRTLEDKAVFISGGLYSNGGHYGTRFAVNNSQSVILEATGATRDGTAGVTRVRFSDGEMGSPSWIDAKGSEEGSVEDRIARLERKLAYVAGGRSRGGVYETVFAVSNSQSVVLGPTGFTRLSSAGQSDLIPFDKGGGPAALHEVEFATSSRRGGDIEERVKRLEDLTACMLPAVQPAPGLYVTVFAVSNSHCVGITSQGIVRYRKEGGPFSGLVDGIVAFHEPASSPHAVAPPPPPTPDDAWELVPELHRQVKVVPNTDHNATSMTISNTSRQSRRVYVDIKVKNPSDPRAIFPTPDSWFFGTIEIGPGVVLREVGPSWAGLQPGFPLKGRWITDLKHGPEHVLKAK